VCGSCGRLRGGGVSSGGEPVSALQAECIAVAEALAAAERGEWYRASVWLRLADEANVEQGA